MNQKGRKQNEVRQVIFENNLSVFAILESHVADSKLHKMCWLVFRHWDWSSNGAWCNKGTRIILGWNHNDVDIMVVTQDDQAVHARVWLKLEKKEVFCSFIYAHNRYNQRRSLWKGLSHHKLYVRDRPWCLLGDFNSTLYLDETTTGTSRIDIAMREFKECVDDIEVMDVQNSGLQFTWSQKPKGYDGILKKLDRIMSNQEFLTSFVGAHAIFKPYRISDHSPSILSIPLSVKSKPKPFKFYNIITKHERFLNIVKDLWCNNVSGFFMYRIVKKLKTMKKPLRKLLYEKGNLHDNVIRLRSDLDQIQTLLDKDPFNSILREKEADCVVEFNQAVLLEERFLKQKAKIHWLKEGDSNSAYFHKAVKSRVSRSRIDVVMNGDGLIFINGFNDTNLFTKCLDDQVALYMVRTVTDQEVKEAMFSMGDDKSPGPDGYTAAFFKEAWEIVGTEVTQAIREFFINGNLLKEINHTIIALIPKVKSPTRVNDYRPISCCNVLFKCISKIIANRIKQSLKILVSPNQSAFIPGRCISDNILLTQELMHNYHLDRGTPRCAFKVDIQKAYDTVDWVFLRKVLNGFGFHERMISWIMECVTTTSYSISINGSLHGYFQGKRGLRQGDPLSPYLFTLVMEILTLMLQRRVVESGEFGYHRYCSKLDLINLCFADDLFLFAYGDVQSVSVIRDGLEKVQIRVQDWKNKSLSIAGRLQLIRSVLGSLHVFWASVFIIPNRVLLDIEQIMRGFLWCQGPMAKGKAKVAWEVVCLPKDEGGLGIRRLEHFNSALMVSHIWKLITLKESLWVKWIHEYKLKGRSFWDIPLRGNMSWGWRKILQLRPIVREFCWHKIGNGACTSLWFDRWCDEGPIANHVSSRDMFRSGLNATSKVKDIVLDGNLVWPQFLIHKYPILNSCHAPIFVDTRDKLEWRMSDGSVKKFSVNQVWSSIRPRDIKVPWYDMVWFSVNIPRHAFNMWLIVKHKLKTQDKVCCWDDSIGSSCPLCDGQPDSHEHLFFQCPFSHDIWSHMKGLAGLDRVAHDVYEIVDHLGSIAKIRSSHVVIAKLVVAASAYFIWQERNWRLFKKSKRSVHQVIECISSAVRLKLLSCSFKRTMKGVRYARLWDLPDSIFK
ncbi:hypothetical protein Tco_0576414 [Tanacetum coccineum]